MTKSIVPIISRFIDTNDVSRPEAKPAILALIKYCNQSMGPSAFMDAFGSPSMAGKAKALL